MDRKSFGWGWASSVAAHAALAGCVFLAHRPGYQQVVGHPLGDDPEAVASALAVDVRDDAGEPAVESAAPELLPAPDATAAAAESARAPVKAHRRAPAVRQPVASLSEPPSVSAPSAAAAAATAPEPRPTGEGPEAPEEIGAAAAEIQAIPARPSGLPPSWLAAATATLPPAISSREASYLRTYETFPNLPRSLWVHGRTYRVLVEVCVTDAGQVADVMVRSGAAPELDQTLVSALRSWRYRPRIVGGAARPFCHLMKMEYKLQG